MTITCCCSELPDLAIVPMGGDGLDERVFASLEMTANHGGDQWWLYASQCLTCGQDWMIAQEERVHDNYFLRRIDAEVKRKIVEQSQWPDEFLTFEQILKLGVDAGKIAIFVDRQSPALVETAAHLRRERPDISIEEIAYLLATSVRNATKLLN